MMISHHHAATNAFLLATLVLALAANPKLVVLAGAFEMSYVLDPFEGRGAPFTTYWLEEDIETNATTKAFQVSFSTDEESYVGNAALQVDYDTTAETGGDENNNNQNLTMSITVTQENRPHICVGATHVSFWYYHDGSSYLLSLRLTLLDDSETCMDCDVEANWDTWDHWTTIIKLLQAEEAQSGEGGEGWQEIRVALGSSDFQQTNAENTNGNNQLDLHRIRGFRIQLEVQPGTIGQIRIDQLALVGGPDLFGSAFFATTDDFATLVETEGGWEVDPFNSDLSGQNSTVLMNPNNNGTLQIDYLVQHAENWGGLLAYSYKAPGAAYYNVSNATFLTFEYEINKAVSNPQRVHLRFILADASDCVESCDSYGGKLERFYSFHYILADPLNVTKQLSLPLEGSTDPSSPFWLTGWSGDMGNRQLNKDQLKGYTFEFNIDQYGDLLSYATGAITFGDLQVMDYNPSPYNTVGFTPNGDNSTFCVHESGIAFDGTSDVFTLKELVGDHCCEECEKDPTCVYVLSTGRDCFLASHLEEGAVGLDVPIVGDYTVVRKETLQAYWMDSATKRGNFCGICDCNATNQTIDCRGKDLTVVPKTFNGTKEGELFEPRSLDLRDNPRLVLLGSGSLASIADNLRELWLPKEMIHLGEYSLDNLPELEHVGWEGQENDTIPLIAGGNIIAGPSDFFGSVCCGLGKHIDLASPEEGLTFCDTTHVFVDDPPGIDAVYLPFVRYKDPTVLKVLFPSSDFMSEAAESIGTCAEFCHVYQDCQYFSYDNRISNAEPICLFLEDDGDGEEFICCKPGQFADEEMTFAGWTSGRPPGTRHIIDNATVLIQPQAFSLNPENDYQLHFEVSLGAFPVRGGVYVTPSLIDDKNLNVTLWPSKVGLYNENMTAQVNVKVFGLVPGAPSQTLQIHASIDSCDQAFTTIYVSSCEESLVVDIAVDIPYLYIEEPALGPLSYSATIVGCVAIMLVFVTAALVHMNRTKKAITFAQIEFLRLLLAGSFLTSTGAILVGVPPTDGTCMAAIWFIEVGYTLELVPLIVKIAALNRLMAAAERMRRVTLKRRNLFGAVALIMGLVLVYLTIWTILEPSQKVADDVQTEDEEGYTTVTTTYYCSGYHSAWSIIALAWKCVLLLAASVLAFQTRKIKRQAFNESQTLAFLIYSHFVFICMRFALLFLTEHVPEPILIKVRSLLNSADTIAAVMVYFVPKLIAKDDAINGREQPTTTSMYDNTTTILESRRASTVGMVHPPPPMNGHHRFSTVVGLEQQPSRVRVSTTTLLSSIHEE